MGLLKRVFGELERRAATQTLSVMQSAMDKGTTFWTRISLLMSAKDWAGQAQVYSDMVKPKLAR
jgi:hypothetical protein